MGVVWKASTNNAEPIGSAASIGSTFSIGVVYTNRGVELKNGIFGYFYSFFFLPFRSLGFWLRPITHCYAQLIDSDQRNNPSGLSHVYYKWFASVNRKHFHFWSHFYFASFVIDLRQIIKPCVSGFLYGNKFEVRPRKKSVDSIFVFDVLDPHLHWASKKMDRRVAATLATASTLDPPRLLGGPSLSVVFAERVWLVLASLLRFFRGGCRTL